MTGELITVNLRRVEGNWTVATSDDLPGLFLTYPEQAKVIEEIPQAIQLIYKVQYGTDVTVIMLKQHAAQQPVSERLPFATIPAHLLSQASAG